MAKNIVLLAVIIAAVSYLAGCGRMDDGLRLISVTASVSPTLTVTPTITPTQSLFAAFASCGMGITEVKILLVWTPMEGTVFAARLRQNNEGGAPILGAAIDVNGNTLTDNDGKGDYIFYSLNKLYSPGDSITMNIFAGLGSTSATVLMPDAASITFPASHTTIDPGVDNTVFWSYPAGQPAEVNIGAGRLDGNNAELLLDVVLPGTETHYTIPANTLPAGLSDIYLGVGGISRAALTGVEAGSNSFSARNGNTIIINTQ